METGAIYFHRKWYLCGKTVIILDPMTLYRVYAGIEKRNTETVGGSWPDVSCHDSYILQVSAIHGALVEVQSSLVARNHLSGVNAIGASSLCTRIVGSVMHTAVMRIHRGDTGS